MNHPYAEFVHTVEKPARYLGGELHAIRKPWATAEARVVLAFPDVYDVGMSHLGTKILYSTLNKVPRLVCERAFAPWPDMERQLRARQLPLVSLESARPLRDFDAIGCSLQWTTPRSAIWSRLPATSTITGRASSRRISRMRNPRLSAWSSSTRR